LDKKTTISSSKTFQSTSEEGMDNDEEEEMREGEGGGLLSQSTLDQNGLLLKNKDDRILQILKQQVSSSNLIYDISLY